MLVDMDSPPLDQLRDTPYYRRLDETGRRRLHELLARLLPLIAQSKAPDATLVRVLKIIERIGGRTVYLALLNENAAALRRLVALCEQSQFLADQISAQPLLLDELIDERLIEETPTRAQFAEELALRRQNMQDEEPERQVEMLREFQSAALFRVAVADLIGRLPLMKVSDRLTDIAELLVQETLVLARSQIEARHGVPRYTDASGTACVANMIVVAYGKLGGLELGYASDLDLVFLHDSSGESQRTDGAQPIDNTLFFQRLGQRLVHLLTVHSASGRLYEVDTRLRPAGNRGLLVQSLAAFREYEFQDAWTWEHQSLLRARAVAGPAQLCEQFETARIEVLRKAVKRDGLRDEVRRMRERMRENLSKARRRAGGPQAGSGRDRRPGVPGAVLDAQVGGPLSRDRHVLGQHPPAGKPGLRRDRAAGAGRFPGRHLPRLPPAPAPPVAGRCEERGGRRRVRGGAPRRGGSLGGGHARGGPSVERFAIMRAMSTEPGTKLIQPNAQNQYMVTATDLPLSCPMPGMHLWNSHPRVFLPIEKTGWAKCPYCGAEYTLIR